MIDDLTHLRRAIELSRAARERGDHPFGALLVGAGGAVLLESLNAVVTGTDVTAHAESALVRAAWAAIPHDALPGATLYSSCEPCAMCAGAIFWSGIGRVVYALGSPRLRSLLGDGPESVELPIPVREVLAAGSRPTEVVGPLLEDEAAVPHAGFWRP